MKGLIKIYDRLRLHKGLLGLSCALVVVGLIVLTLRLRYEEDIFDFLPQNADYTESMEVYSQLSEASRIVIIFEGNNQDSIVEAIDAFAERCEQTITQVDMTSVLSRLHFVYDHLPYFLTESSYQFLDSVYQSPDTLRAIMAANKQVLSLPGTSFLYPALARDPLHLVPIARSIAGQYASAQSNFDTYNGYMVTKDGHKGFAFYDSPYGSTETQHNAALVDSLTALTQAVEEVYTTIDVRLLGSPVIAVGNARRIKRDSMGAIICSSVLILALLFYSFPRKRDIGLIVLSVGFGWLCGMAALAAFFGQVSMIVLGIGSVLIGIAINYPLHLLVHQRYTTSVRQTLEEVLSPLITGNITTVGAFMALIPLHSPALRQLGLFASAMFLGTILFCVFVLPHLMSSTPTPIRELCLPNFKLSTLNFKLSTLLLLVLFLCSGLFLLIKRPTMFDPNLSHINYMTEQQRSDFAWFESLSPVSDEPAYLASTAREELNRRWALWEAFWLEHDQQVLAEKVQSAGQQAGFMPTAFAAFGSTLASVQQTQTEDASQLAQVWPGRFDSQAMNKHVTTTLTDHFDYIGMICSLIVFVFLCISFRSLKLGIIAFVPMLLSWVLIFGLMYLFGLQFNLVNVILATFIFGQGDDYTIFVVEGLRNERLYGKRLLDQYKQSIILSATVMLLAIGVLVFAKHPAMHSLGAVTLIGMSCVLLMAFVVPPLLYKKTNK